MKFKALIFTSALISTASMQAMEMHNKITPTTMKTPTPDYTTGTFTGPTSTDNAHCCPLCCQETTIKAPPTQIEQASCAQKAVGRVLLCVCYPCIACVKLCCE